MDTVKASGSSRYKKIDEGSAVTEKEIEIAFKKVDKDKSGKVSKEVRGIPYKTHHVFIFCFSFVYI